jgi:hypothetical protein
MFSKPSNYFSIEIEEQSTPRQAKDWFEINKE